MNCRLPLLTLTVAIVALGCHFVPGASEALQFDRAATDELWRWLTAHCTHFSANHLEWDLAVFAVLGTWCESLSRRRTAGALLIAALAIPTAICCLQPQFRFYRGLSGLDSALFGLAAGALLRETWSVARVVGAAAIAGFAAKCAVEIATSSTVFATGVGYTPVPLAHIVGLTAGLGTCFWPRKENARPTFRPRQKPC